MTAKIAILAGDGIGPEIIDATLGVVEISRDDYLERLNEVLGSPDSTFLRRKTPTISRRFGWKIAASLPVRCA